MRDQRAFDLDEGFADARLMTTETVSDDRMMSYCDGVGR